MAVNGSKFYKNSAPPSSDDLCESWKPWIFETIDLFGFERCMFESNFPVDSASCSYNILWNSFKRIASGLSAEDKSALFHDTATRVYSVDP